MGAEMLVQLLQPDPILLDDPVRPNISPRRRIGLSREVLMWLEDREICAVLCVCFQGTLPIKESELFADDKRVDIAVLYSIWSYKTGCGSKLVRAFQDSQPAIVKRIVTMSPKTEMARQFHLKNGANVLQTNKTTVNYEY
jgi:hypothetical protein